MIELVGDCEDLYAIAGDSAQLSKVSALAEGFDAESASPEDLQDLLVNGR